MRPILVVEDNARDLELTLAAFKRCKVANEIVVARDGHEALGFLRSQEHAAADPAVVVLDNQLTGMSGLDVLAVMKQDRRLKNIPVVMLTGSALPKDISSAYELGTNGYVVKPLSFEALVRGLGDLSRFWTTHNKMPN